MFRYPNYDLTDVILNVYKNHSQSLSLYERKVQLRQKLYDLLKNDFDENFDLYIVGSTQTQFGLASSDLDLCLVLYDSSGKLNKKYFYKNKLIVEKLAKIQQIVLRNDLASSHQLLSSALVPIFRFTDKINQITVDLNINRLVTIRNTFLLSCYNSLDRRVALLMVAVKCWARKNGINSSFRGTLSSYSLTLMVIHFLQNGCNPPVLPHLPAICGDETMRQIDECGRLTKPIDSLRRSASLAFMQLNHWSLGALFTQFIYYYNQPHVYNRVIAISNYPTLRHSQTSSQPSLVIEDPFERKNTAYTLSQFESIKQTFQSTWHAIIYNDFFADQFEFYSTK